MAFQLSAFQRSAFQIGYRAQQETPPSGGHPDYIYSTHRLRREFEYKNKIVEEKRELERLKIEIAEAESKRLIAEKAKVKKNAAKKLAALQAQLEREINRLSILQAALIQRIKEDEAALVILLVARRRRFGVV